MAAIDDLNTAVVTLQNEDQLVLAFITSLETKLANIPTDDSVVVEAAVSNINTEISNFKAALAQQITSTPATTGVPVTVSGVTGVNAPIVTPPAPVTTAPDATVQTETTPITPAVPPMPVAPVTTTF